MIESTHNVDVEEGWLLFGWWCWWFFGLHIHLQPKYHSPPRSNTDTHNHSDCQPPPTSFSQPSTIIPSIINHYPLLNTPMTTKPQPPTHPQRPTPSKLNHLLFSPLSNTLIPPSQHPPIPPTHLSNHQYYTPKRT